MGKPSISSTLLDRAASHPKFPVTPLLHDLVARLFWPLNTTLSNCSSSETCVNIRHPLRLDTRNRSVADYEIAQSRQLLIPILHWDTDMPYTPLIPLPDDASSASPDPFDVLLGNPASTSSASSNIRPLFPRHISQKSKSIKIPKNSSEPTSVDAGTSSSLTRGLSSSAESDFGAFVSVSPSQDPLGPSRNSSFGFPSSEEDLIGGEAELPSQNTAFVEGAKQRAYESEQRILNEFLQHPLNVISETEPRAEPNDSDLLGEPQSAVDSADSPFFFDDSLHTDNELEFIPKSEVPGSGTTTPKPGPSLHQDATRSKLVRSPLPLPANIGDVASIPPSLLDGDYYGESTEPSASSSLSGSSSDVHHPIDSQLQPSASMSTSFSSTLHRTWSSLISSSPPSSRSKSQPPSIPYFEHPPSGDGSHLPHSPSSGSLAHTISIPASYHNKEITHDSPFAVQPYTPPSGAPGAC